MIKMRWNKTNNNLVDTSVQNTDLNMIIDVINNGIQVINKIKEEYMKDIE